MIKSVKKVFPFHAAGFDGVGHIFPSSLMGNRLPDAPELLNWLSGCKCSICISDFMQTTGNFFYHERFPNKLADNQYSFITKGSIYHIKHNVDTTFYNESGFTWNCTFNWSLYSVSYFADIVFLLGTAVCMTLVLIIGQAHSIMIVLKWGWPWMVVQPGKKSLFCRMIYFISFNMF